MTELSVSQRNCHEYAQVSTSVINVVSVWPEDDLTHLQVFIIDGPSGAPCDRGRERWQFKNSRDTYHHLIQY